MITPLNPYLIMLLTMLRRYEPEAGFGTLIARLLPFVVPFWVSWVLVLTVLYVGDIPPGPGSGVQLGG